MKKVTFLAAAIALLGVASVDANAQATQEEQTQQTQQTQTQQEQIGAQAQTESAEGKKEKITEDQLPEPIKQALKSDTYKDWTVSEINKVSPAAGEGSQEAGKIVYEVTFTNTEGQSGVARFDETGKPASTK
ncbi:hypothetical protein ACFSKU_17505 [Pontibacter silvestris]|uniref:PepSY domain-containing protein n=1 Tax=Pontibacter silvestris TaxID=2305183 RepID=A0ABW4X2X9_9BACT|nr:hypothetical protein [Pontibacter silvestris]MCC9135821.1 hypothetical protein [Pontibacter silvestris]